MAQLIITNKPKAAVVVPPPTPAFDYTLPASLIIRPGYMAVGNSYNNWDIPYVNGTGQVIKRGDVLGTGNYNGVYFYLVSSGDYTLNGNGTMNISIAGFTSNINFPWTNFSVTIGGLTKKTTLDFATKFPFANGSGLAGAGTRKLEFVAATVSDVLYKDKLDFTSVSINNTSYPLNLNMAQSTVIDIPSIFADNVQIGLNMSRESSNENRLMTLRIDQGYFNDGIVQYPLNSTILHLNYTPFIQLTEPLDTGTQSLKLTFGVAAYPLQYYTDPVSVNEVHIDADTGATVATFPNPTTLGKEWMAQDYRPNVNPAILQNYNLVNYPSALTAVSDTVFNSVFLVRKK